MAVAVDRISADVTSNSVASKSLTTFIVGSGSNRALIVALTLQSTATSPSVHWDTTGTNQALTLIGSKAASSVVTVYLYGLVAPTSGTKTLTATWTGTSDVTLAAGAFTDVDQTGGTTSFAHFNSAAASTGTPSLTVTSATGDYVIGALGDATGAFSANGNTSWYLDNAPNTYSAAGNYAVGASTVTLTNTTTGSTWCYAGVDVVAAIIPPQSAAITESGTAADTVSCVSSTDPSPVFNWQNASNTSTNSSATSIVCGTTNAATTNGAIAVGDLLIVVVSLSFPTPANANAPSISDGTYTLIYSHADTTSGVAMGVWYKIATSTSASTPTVTWTTSITAAAFAMLDYGSVFNGAPDVSAGSDNTTFSGNLIAPSISTTSAPQTMICVWGTDGGSNPYAGPAGMSTRANNNPSSSGQAAIVVSDSTLVAAGPTGTRLATSGSTRSHGVSIAVKPSSGTVSNNTIAETGTAADTVNFANSTYVGLIADSGSTSDTSNFANSTYVGLTADSGSASDATNAGASTYLGAVAESGTAADSSTGANQALGAITEAGTASDSVNEVNSIYVGSIAESGSATDTTSDTDVSIEIITETGSTSDTTNFANSTYVGLVAESGSASDATNAGASTYRGAVAESGTAADTTTAANQALGAITEAGTASDSVNEINSIYVGAIAESGSGSDTVSAINAGALAIIAESGTATDSVHEVNSIYVGVIAESGSASDTTSDTNVSIEIITESGSASDTVTAINAGTLAVIAESGSTTDSVNAVGSIYLGAITESGSASDTTGDVDVSINVIAESGSASDTVTAVNAGAISSTAEAGTATDTSTAVLVSTQAISESGLCADAVALQSLKFAVVAEIANLNDSLVVGSEYQSFVAELAAAVDTAIVAASIYGAFVREFGALAASSGIVIPPPIKNIFQITTIAGVYVPPVGPTGPRNLFQVSTVTNFD